MMIRIVAVLPAIGLLPLCLFASALASGGEPASAIDRYGDPLPAGASMRLGTVRLRHECQRGAGFVFTPDGRTIISIGSDDQMIRFWNVADGKEVRVLGPTEFGACAIAISPDGKLLATGRFELCLWDLTTGKKRTIVTGGLTSMAFAPDGNTLVTGGEDGVVRIWDVATSKERRRQDWHRRIVSRIAISPDGKTLMSASEIDGTIEFSKVDTGEEISRLTLGHADVIAFSPDGRFIAVGQWGNEKPDQWYPVVRLLDAPTGALVLQIRAPQRKYISALAFSPDSKTLVLARFEDAIQLWNVETGQMLRAMPTGAQRCHGLVISPDGKTLAMRNERTGIRLFDVATGKELNRREGHQERVSTLDFSPDGKMLASTAFVDDVILWDVGSGRLLRVLGQDSFVRSAQFLPDGKSLITGGGDNYLRIWDAQSGLEIRKLSLKKTNQADERWQVSSMQLTLDGKKVFVQLGGSNSEVACLDVDTGRTVDRRPNPVLVPIAFAPDCHSYCAETSFGTVLTNVAREQDVKTLKSLDRLAWPYIFSSDSTLVALRELHRHDEGQRHWVEYPSIRVYDVASGAEKFRITTHGAGCPLAFSPDRRWLAAADTGGLYLWDLSTGKERRHGDRPGSSCARFSPDGKKLAVGFSDSSIVIFDVAALVGGH
jgi:WD40 repeat protein